MMEDQAAAGPAETPATSRWEDYIDVFISPAELFLRRAADKVSVPLLTLMGIGIVLYFVMLPANRMIMDAAMANQPPQAAEFMEQWGGIMTLFGAVMVPVIYGIMIAWTAAVLWLVGRFASIRIDYDRAALIATYAAFVFLLGSTLALVAIIIHGPVGLDPVRHVSFGPLRFVGHVGMDGFQAALLRRFELFTLWQAALWAVGIRQIYKVSTGKAALIAAIAWLLVGLPGMIGGMLGFGETPANAG